MSLAVSAAVIRELIVDGEYIIEYLEQRGHGGVLVTFALRSRAQPCSVQIETTDAKLATLFRALLHADGQRSDDAALRRVGSQPVPVVHVDEMPADQAKPRRRRAAKADQNGGQPAEARAPRAERRRAALRQLTLVPGVSSAPGGSSTAPLGKRRGRPRSSQVGEPL
jgi:hypothetical protein